MCDLIRDMSKVLNSRLCKSGKVEPFSGSCLIPDTSNIPLKNYGEMPFILGRRRKCEDNSLGSDFNISCFTFHSNNLGLKAEVRR